MSADGDLCAAPRRGHRPREAEISVEGVGYCGECNGRRLDAAYEAAVAVLRVAAPQPPKPKAETADETLGRWVR